MIKVVLDCMGGDNSPYAHVEGAVLAISENKNLKLVLVGDGQKINFELQKYKFDKSRIEVVFANDVIFGDEEPVKSVRNKKDSSLIVSLIQLIENNCDAIISTGNTGAFLFGCLFYIGRIEGVDRPALAPIIKSDKRKFILLDCGANVDCKSKELIQFARLGSIYYKIMFDVDNPIVKLLNIGFENNKGNSVVRNVFDELSKDCEINFCGNVEARDIMSDNSNVIVCDGFVGNITLKTIEGIVQYLMKRILFFNFLKKLVDKFKNKYDYEKSSGAIFLGVNEICIKSHGNSNEIAIKNSINMACKLKSKNFIQNLKKDLFVK